MWDVSFVVCDWHPKGLDQPTDMPVRLWNSSWLSRPRSGYMSDTMESFATPTSNFTSPHNNILEVREEYDYQTWIHQVTEGSFKSLVTPAVWFDAMPQQHCQISCIRQTILASAKNGLATTRGKLSTVAVNSVGLLKGSWWRLAK